ncbi:hypothetical protein TNCV_3273511 [Trichonephila clavipes]|nr:hypothetical protein TNCV_3273511 [Trichonephila clavipes]
MSSNTLRVYTGGVVLAKLVGLKALWAVAAEATGVGGCRIFPSPPVLCLNCGGFPPVGATAYQLLHRSINHQVANRVTKNDANLALYYQSFACFH